MTEHDEGPSLLDAALQRATAAPSAHDLATQPARDEVLEQLGPPLTVCAGDVPAALKTHWNWPEAFR